MPFPEIPSSASVAGEHHPVDLSVLAELIGDNKLTMHKFICKFIESARQEIATIESALERKDCAALCTLGHHNKSPAGMVGATGFANLCHKLEEYGKSGDIEQARGIAAQMRSELERVHEQIKKLQP